jgi:hypothetical protein
VVPLDQIKFGEPLGAARFVQEGVDVLQLFNLRLYDGVEAPVVVTDSPRPVRLPGEHHRGSVPCGRVLDPPAVQQVTELAPQLSQLSLLQPLEGLCPQHGAIVRLEDQLDAPVRRKAGPGPPEDVCKLVLELC